MTMETDEQEDYQTEWVHQTNKLDQYIVEENIEK